MQPVARTGWPSRARRACTRPAATRWSSAPSRCPTASSMGHEGMHFSLVSREVIADSVEIGHAGRAAGRLGAARRLRQVAAGHADGRRPARPRQRVPVRRVDPARDREDVRRHRAAGHDHRRLRGGRCVCPRADEPRGRRRDRARDLPGRGRLRRHVHREHDGQRGRGARHVAAGQRRAAGHRPAPRRVRPALRRGRRRAAAPGHHGARDHDHARRSRTRSPW